MGGNRPIQKTRVLKARVSIARATALAQMAHERGIPEGLVLELAIAREIDWWRQQTSRPSGHVTTVDR
jgi:hypothetical protein